MYSDKVYRIGDKLISFEKLMRLADRALSLREQGLSQQEAAKRLDLDRSFISRLESTGELRKGSKVAVIGFPLENKEEIRAICLKYGLDFFLVMDNKERWGLVEGKEVMDFFNSMLELVSRLRLFDTLIMVTSEKWLRLAEVLLDIQIVYLALGPTPIQVDRRIDPEKFETTLNQVLPDH